MGDGEDRIMYTLQLHNMPPRMKIVKVDPFQPGQRARTGDGSLGHAGRRDRDLVSPYRPRMTIHLLRQFLPFDRVVEYVTESSMRVLLAG